MKSMKRQKCMAVKEEPPRSVGVQYATGEEQKNNSRRNEEAEPKGKWHPAVDVAGDECPMLWECCIGTWNVRSMNWGKLDVVKQEVVRGNINILAISELKWTGMGEFNSDDHYIYHGVQEPLRRNGVAFTVNKRIWNAVFECNLKYDRMIFHFLHQKNQKWSFISKANHSISR